MNQIHPTAIISPQAKLGTGLSIGPWCVIEDDVVIGDGCKLGNHVSIKSGTELGENNQIYDGAVLGGSPQHLRAGERLGRLLIGNGNLIREHVTIHRGLTEADATTVGDQCMLMVNVHIAHDCHIGSQCIIANNTMLAGHITVGDHAYISGAVGVHQFCRIGSYAMVGGQAHIKADVPPFVTVDGKSSLVVGLNSIGLRRKGFTAADIAVLKRAYRVIYRSGHRWADVLVALQAEFPTGPAAAFYPFLSTGKRGFVQERHVPRAATVPFSTDSDGESDAKEVRMAS